jgi:hypothetical protein
VLLLEWIASLFTSSRRCARRWLAGIESWETPVEKRSTHANGETADCDEWNSQAQLIGNTLGSDAIDCARELAIKREIRLKDGIEDMNGSQHSAHNANPNQGATETEPETPLLLGLRRHRGWHVLCESISPLDANWFLFIAIACIVNHILHNFIEMTFCFEA